jgi:hypothetical protein
MNPTFTVSIDLEKRKTSVTGLVAVGEKVNVVISGIDLSTIPEWEADNDEGFIGPALRFRLVTSTGKDLVRFPLADGDKWTVEGNSLSAEVDFNTMQLREWLHSFPIDGKAEVGIIVDSVVDAMEYGRGSVKILQWAASPAEDPTILPDWRKTLRELNEAIVEISYKSEQAVNAATSAESAKELARDSANSANVAANNAVKSENEAKGFRNESLTAAENASAFANNAKASQTAAENAKNAAESARDEAKGYAESAASTLANAATKAELQAEVDRAIAAERDNALVIGEVSKTLMDEMDRAKAADNNLESQITGIGNKVDDLVADDKSKSVRTIAAEEVAKVIAGADTNYDTLKEIADYIKEDATDAAQLKNKVKNLENTKADVAALETETARAQRAEAALSGRVKELEEKPSVEVVAPDSEATEGQAADAKATYDALEGKVARGENLFAYDEDGYPISPDLFTFYGQSAPGVAIYGAVGLDGFMVRTMDEEGGGTLCAAAMTPGFIYADYIYGGLTDYNDRGYNGVAHIEFSPMADIGYRYYYGSQQEEYHSVGIESLVQTAYDYSSGYLNNLAYMSFSPGSMNEIMFYMGQSDSDSRTIRLDDVYTAVYESNYGSIQFGDNYYDASTDYAFSLVDTSDYQTRTSFGAYGVSVRGGYGGSYDHAEFGNYITQMRGMTSDVVENYVVMYNSGIETNGYLQATNGDIYYTSIYPTGVDTTGSIHVSDGSRTYAYLSQSGLSIYGDVGYMTLSASSIGFWDAEHQTGTVLSFDEFRAVKQMVNALNKTTIDHFEGVNVSDMTQEQKSEILDFFVTEYFNAKKSLKGMG